MHADEMIILDQGRTRKSCGEPLAARAGPLRLILVEVVTWMQWGAGWEGRAVQAEGTVSAEDTLQWSWQAGHHVWTLSGKLGSPVLLQGVMESEPDWGEWAFMSSSLALGLTWEEHQTEGLCKTGNPKDAAQDKVRIHGDLLSVDAVVADGAAGMKAGSHGFLASQRVKPGPVFDRSIKVNRTWIRLCWCGLWSLPELSW